MEISDSVAFGSYYHTNKNNTFYIKGENVQDNSNVDLICKECGGISMSLDSFNITTDMFVKYKTSSKSQIITDDMPIRVNQPPFEVQMNCPCCKKETIHFICDAELSYAISILNKKGYSTKFCCSGHEGYDPNIIFTRFYRFSVKPVYWKAIRDSFEKNPRLILRLKRKYRSAAYIEKAFRELNTWVSSLPKIPNPDNMRLPQNVYDYGGEVVNLIVMNTTPTPEDIHIRNYDEIRVKIDNIEKHIDALYAKELDEMPDRNDIAEMKTKLNILKWVVKENDTL